MTFREELEHLINSYSLENTSDTPDFLLAEYLQDCLTAFDKAVQLRERWYGRACGQGKAIMGERNVLDFGGSAEGTPAMEPE